MWYTVCVICLALYLLCSAWFLANSIIQVHLLWHARKKKYEPLLPGKQSLPHVTIQVPVYNERYVIVRLLEALAELHYPKSLYDVQILDDSTDDTSKLIDVSVDNLRLKGMNVQVIRRQIRKGFKAGALQEALPLAKGELIAIFDADFNPHPDFLQRMVSYFDDPKLGGVQGRWAHENLNQNPLTLIQSFLLDSHFQLEQQGRYAAGYFLNFNGTAGIWRKKCIEESGGWNSAVLTEDLELSYRAQLKGWRFRYDNDTIVPAELPSDVEAFKSQQFRWAKGMAQTAATHLRGVLHSNASISKKAHAFFHLLGSLSFVAVMGNILLTLPLNAGRHYFPEFAEMSTVILYTGVTLPLVCFYYYFGTKPGLTRTTFWKYLPLFLVIYMALSVQNSIAVLQGLFKHKSPFVRTPKTNGKNETNNSYTGGSWTTLHTIETVMCIYTGIAILLCLVWQDYFLLLFLLMVFTGQVILLSKAFGELWKSRPQPEFGS